MKNINFRSENVRGDEYDVIKLARQALNRSNASRVISKQECMVELTGLPLTICSEDIENVNISGALKLHESKTNKDNTNIIQRYQKRSTELEALSLCQFFYMEHKVKTPMKTTIPHFIGMSSTPTFPPTPTYAKSILITHKPWRNAKFYKLNDEECISEFINSIRKNEFPASVILAYNKVKQQHTKKTLHIEITQRQECYDNDDYSIAEEEQELIRAMTKLTSNYEKVINIKGVEYNRGLDYDWSQRDDTVSSKLRNTILIKEMIC